MRRVLVIGSGGAGKSVLARRMGERLGLEVIHLDVHYWRPGWAEPPEDAWRDRVRELIARDAWVMDGNFGGTLEMRVERADTVVLLDLPRLLCAWRVLSRWRRWRGRSRPDLAPGCPEGFDLPFLRWVWRYPKDSRPNVLAVLDRHRDGRRVEILRSRRAVDRFVRELQ